MSLTTSRGMHCVRCDWKPERGTDYLGPGFCSARFLSASSPSVLQRQLELADWYSIAGTKSRARVDFCPAHRARSQREQAISAHRADTTCEGRLKLDERDFSRRWLA